MVHGILEALFVLGKAAEAVTDDTEDKLAGFNIFLVQAASLTVVCGIVAMFDHGYSSTPYSVLCEPLPGLV